MSRTLSKRVIPWVGLAAVALFLFSSGCWEEPQSPVEDLDSADFVPLFGGAASTAMESPTRVASSSSGELLVSESRNNVVLTVNPATLLPEQSLEIQGRPLAVGRMGGRLFVGNATTKTVEIYDQRGRRRGTLGHVEKPIDLAVDEGNGWLFILNAGRNVVEVYDKRGRIVDEIAGPGTAPHELLTPMGVAVDPVAQEVYVTDYGDMDAGNASIKIFDYQGQFLGAISGEGNCGLLGCSGGFSRPQGIAVDGQGQIFIVDVLLAQVLVFDRTTLKITRVLGGRNAGSHSLRRPLDIIIGANADLFVTSNGTGTVAVFRGGAVAP